MKYIKEQIKIRKNILMSAENHLRSLHVAFKKFAKGSDVETDYAREKLQLLSEDVHALIANSRNLRGLSF